MTTEDLVKLRAQLITHEGLRLFPYRDSVGKLTIGCGRNLADRGITQGEAMELLEHDIAVALGALTGRAPWVLSLDAIRLRVLIDMVFNMGPDRFFGFQRAIAATHRGDYRAAALEMLRSEWAHQVGIRAAHLAAMMETGNDMTT